MKFILFDEQGLAKVATVLAFFLMFFLAASFLGISREDGFAAIGKVPSILGGLTSYTIKDDEMTLVKLARRYNLGYDEITLANPGLDPWNPGAGARVLLPTSWIVPREIVPDGSGSRIVVNLGELRLYFLDSGENKPVVTSFPVGIGRQGFETTPGRYWIIEKEKDPYWNIPPSLWDEYPEEAGQIPPGSLNPLGDYALRLSRHDYLIHGTNKPMGIGRRISHGCIRMYPEDIETLYEMTPEGCEVLVVYETVKVGVREDIPYVEVHPDYLHNSDQLLIARHLLTRKGLWEKVDFELLSRAVNEKRGIPLPLQ